MTNKLKAIIIILLLAAGALLLFRLVFVRTVYYEIGGIKIPSKYNMLTGSVKPISNYNGKTNLRTVETRKTNKMGLTEDEVIIARMRWAIFEEWANTKPEFRGWQNDAQLFKRAYNAFKKQLDSYGGVPKK